MTHDTELRDKLKFHFIDYGMALVVSGHTIDEFLDNAMEDILADRKRAIREARLQALQWALNDYNMPDTDTKANLEDYIADLTPKSNKEQV